MAKIGCRYCGSEIAEEAKLCPICKSYQKPWRNGVLFVAGLTGFLAILASAVTFIVDRSSEVYRTLFWKDQINLLQFSSSDPYYSISLVNTGYGPVLLSSMIIKWRDATRSVPLNNIVENHGFAILTGKGSQHTQRFTVASSSGLLTKQMIAHLDLMLTPLEQPCFYSDFYDPDNGIVAMQSARYALDGLRLVSESAEVEFSFFSSRTGHLLKTKSPLVVIYSQDAVSPNCKNIRVD